MDTLLKIYQRYREQILYLFSGLSTTIVNIFVYTFATRILRLEVLVANVVAWIVAVTIAYLLNKNIVFQKKRENIGELLKEMMSFYSARIATLILESVLLWTGIHIFRIPDLLVKVFSNAVVIVSNYILAKIFIFREK